MDDVLLGGLVDALERLAHAGLRLVGGVGLEDLLHGRTHGGTDGLVGHATGVVGDHALLCLLGVGHLISVGASWRSLFVASPGGDVGWGSRRPEGGGGGGHGPIVMVM